MEHVPLEGYPILIFNRESYVLFYCFVFYYEKNKYNNILIKNEYIKQSSNEFFKKWWTVYDSDRRCLLVEMQTATAHTHRLSSFE